MPPIPATEFTPVSALLGGLLIGLAALLLMAGTGRIAGISGIVGNLPETRGAEAGWRLLFVAGLLSGAALWVYAGPPGAVAVELVGGAPLLLLAGLLVGAGTRLGSGCTSGHGVCGIGRRSPRSLAATATFMAVAALTVYLVHHLLGA